MKIKNLGLLFKKQAQKNPSETCLDFGSKNKITYKEIDELSDKLAIYLGSIRVKENDRVSIESKKDLFSYVLVLACLKRGVIYSFFDSNDGKNRINHILNIVKPKKIFLFSKDCQKKLKKKNSLIINETFIRIIKNIDLNKKPLIIKNIYFNAYIMFTSGSTGKPKGVLINHHNLSFFINWVKKTFNIGKKTVMTNLNPLHFDNSVFDLYGSLLNSATLVPVEKKDILIPNILSKRLKSAKCEVWFSVPSLLDLILQLGGYNIFKKYNFKKMIFGGERFPLQSVKKIFNICKKTKFYNVSGPTECTCMCSSYELKKKDLKNAKDISVGKISNYFKYRIHNSKKNKSNTNEKIGELFLEGPAVSQGYFNDKKRTKDKFYYRKGLKGYKTGDLVKENRKKFLKIIGRSDNQIKFLGHRIELEEIEKVFIKRLKIKNCIASLKLKKQYPYKKITITLDKKVKDLDLIKKKISTSLPKYMIPEEINFVNKFVYNANGKLDRSKY